MKKRLSRHISDLAEVFNGQKTVNYQLVNTLIATLLIGLYNDSMWAMLYEVVGHGSGSALYFYFAFFALASSIIYTLLTVTAVLPGHKIILMTVIVTSALASYFIEQYGIFIDSDMITNVMQTDSGETLNLISFGLIANTLIYGVVPSVVIYRLNIDYGSGFLEYLKKAVMPAVVIALAFALCLPTYSTFASVIRNHKEVRYLMTPSNFIYGFSKAVSRSSKITGPIKHLDDNAKFNESWQSTTANKKPVLFVFIVGETARAANFSLSDYARETNPHLKKQDIIYYSNMTSCGTSTANSLPCMFSNDARQDFSGSTSAAKENLLDLLQNVGLDVFWADNNSGCKGICERVQKIALQEDVNLCASQHCYDMALLQTLEQPSVKDHFIVLHQQGSHGPPYYEQSPDDKKEFFPECQSSQLQSCTRQEIINAYDNTILYTDFFISSVIDRLKELSDRYYTAMIYVSDHGESLGERGLYLHAAPYFMAPDEQTHIPMLAWFSDGFSQHFSIDKECLLDNAAEPVSHDNLFSSILGLLDIESDTYNEQLDIFKSCTTS